MKNKKQYFEEMLTIKDEITSLTNHLTNSTKLSEYYLISIENKINLIKKKYLKLSTTYKENEKREKRIILVEEIMLILTTILSIITGLIAYPIGIALVCTTVLLFTAFFKRALSIKLEKETVEKIKLLTTQTYDNIYNCQIIINEIRRKKTFIERNENTNQNNQQQLFDIANNYISIWIDNSNSSIEEFSLLSYDVQKIIISILQNDLQTDETNIEILISLAKEKLDNDKTYNIALKKVVNQ